MNWLARLGGRQGSTTTIQVSGKSVEVICSASAAKALSRRDRPLVAEIELAFACIARKQVRFHDGPGENNIINVNEKLALRITTITPDACDAAESKSVLNTASWKFLPKWVRIDHARGEWAGELGL